MDKKELTEDESQTDEEEVNEEQQEENGDHADRFLTTTSELEKVTSQIQRKSLMRVLLMLKIKRVVQRKWKMMFFNH